MKFFAAIRLILSTSSSVDVLNATAHDIIRRYILPPLEDDADRGDVGAMELVELYTDYTGRNSRSKIFGAQAFKQIRAVSSRYGFSDAETEDFVMVLVEDIYKRKTWKSFRTVDEGPESFAKWFTGAARNKARSKARDIANLRKHEKHLQPLQDEEHADSLENMPGWGDDPMEALVGKEIQQELRKFMRNQFGKPAQIRLFDAWMEAIVRYGNRLNVRKQVIPQMSDELGIPEGTLYHHLSKMKKAIGDFFWKEYNIRVPLKANDGETMADRVARQEYRRMVADWVLPQHPILRMFMKG